MRQAKWLLLLLAFVVFATGCDIKPEEHLRANPHPIKRVVSLSPSTSELGAMWLRSDIIGRTSSCDYPPSVKDAPVIMQGTKPDFEKITSLRPDGVFYDISLFNQSDIDKFKQLNIPTLGLGGNSLEEFLKNLYIAGSATNNETLVSEYDDTIHKEIEGAKLHLSGRHPKVAIVDATGSGSDYLIAGADGFQADILKQIGAVPVGPKSSLFVKLNPEELIAQNPDAIIVAGNTKDDLREADVKKLYNDPRLQNTTAWKNKSYYGLDAEMVERAGGRMHEYIRQLGNALAMVKQ